MGSETKIEWCHHTFNPWWGCVRVSPGCEHCYAEAFAKRTGNKVWGVRAERRFFGDKHWAEPLKWDAAATKAGERRRVFCASMADVFEDREDLRPHRARLFTLIEATPSLDWLLLTKRPENADRLWAGAHTDAWNGADSLGLTWRPNVWLGTTVEDWDRRKRMDHLRAIPARVRFLSAEPLIEDLGELDMDGIDWVIVGGESGPGSRPFDLAWARSIRDQCASAGVAFFCKQLGARPSSPRDRITHRGNKATMPQGFNRYLNDAKGGDWSEWPEDLRVRQWPEGPGHG